MKYQCLDKRCKHIFEGEAGSGKYQPCHYCPECGWLIAPEDAVEPEAVLKTNSRCYYAYFCHISGGFYHKDCEAGPSVRCHSVIETFLPDEFLKEIQNRRRAHQAIAEVIKRRKAKQ